MTPDTIREVCDSLGTLVIEKQEAYGDSFSKAGICLEQMYPYGIMPNQYGDLLTIVRILDKLFRIATNATAFGESPYSDIAGYALLGTAKHVEDLNKEDSFTT